MEMNLGHVFSIFLGTKDNYRDVYSKQHKSISIDFCHFRF